MVAVWDADADTDANIVAVDKVVVIVANFVAAGEVAVTPIVVRAEGCPA